MANGISPNAIRENAREKTRYFNEYLLYQATLVMNRQRHEKDEEHHTVSELRKFRDDVLSRMEHPMDGAGRVEILNALNQTAHQYGHELAFDDEHYRACLYDFGRLSGLAAMNITVDSPESAHYLPLSPYDDRFADNEFMIQNGQLMFADMNEQDENGEFSMQHAYRLYSSDSRDTYLDTYFNNSHPEQIRAQQDTAMRIESEADVCGVSRLFPFMEASDAKRRELTSWVRSAGADNFISKETMDKSVGLLRKLQDNGIEFTIEPDTYRGQLKASLTGTRISVRIMDTKNNERYVGRVYDNGISVYYTTNVKERVVTSDGKTKMMTKGYDNPSVDEMYYLLQFARGESIDRTDNSGLKVGDVGEYRQQKRTSKNGFDYRPRANTAYFSGKHYSSVMKANENGDAVLIHVENNRSSSSISFLSKDGTPNTTFAEQYLRDAVQTASENYDTVFGLEHLIEEAGKARMNPEAGTTFEFSGEPEIAAVQQNYWNILTGKTSTLFRHFITSDDIQMAFLNGTSVEELQYQGTPEEIVRQHYADSKAALVGSYEPDTDGKRFDPVTVASYMTSEHGVYRNNSNIIQALRALDIGADELRGDDFYNNNVADRLIKYDSVPTKNAGYDYTPPVRMSQHSNPFIKSMGEYIVNTIRETGTEVDEKDVMIDCNGIVHYTARQRTREIITQKDGPQYREIEGVIGQIFPIDPEKRTVYTQFAGSPNYMFSPGYEAYIVPQVPGENKSMEERTRLRGYEQVLKQTIQYQIRSDMMAGGTGRVGETTSINNAYHRLYNTRYELDKEYQAQMMDGMDPELFDAIIKTNARRVRYSNAIQDGSSTNADYQYEMQRIRGMKPTDAINDSVTDPFVLTGRRDMSVIDERSDGYFDRSMSGSSKNQSSVRYLVESAHVEDDGRIVPGDPADETPVMKLDIFRNKDFNPWDRNLMAATQVLTCQRITKHVNTAQMTFGGWTFDDGYVVSKKFAEANAIKGIDGTYRPLMVGDKISDMNGNKGVISLVVDPEMSDEIAAERELTKEVAWFRANPELDVVGAPFSGTSRFNGGSIRTLMEHPKNLISPDGSVLEGCMGETEYIITDKSVDEKTHIYGEMEMAQGKGRKASSQLAWALNAKGCTNILHEFYGQNNGAVQNLREYLIATGLDMDEVGNLRTTYVPHEGENRHVFRQKPLRHKGDDETKPVDYAGMKREFGNEIANTGGFLEVPFALKFPRDGHTMDVGETLGTHLVPILSSYLRSGQTFQDGTSSVHDYTNHYIGIYEQTLRYRQAEIDGDTAVMEKAVRAAQSEYDAIANDIIYRKFDGKYNVFKEEIMAHRVPNSATSVWTADPRLAIDEIGVGSAMAEQLGCKDGDYILVWRDPMLRDEGMAYRKVVVDNNITGCSINPVMDKQFDGDFDGDTVGLVKLQTEAAHREAIEKLSLSQNLLDKGVGKQGKHPLLMQGGLDVAAAAYANPALAKKRNELQERANACYMDDSKAGNKEKQQIADELNQYFHDSLRNEFGNDMICFKDAKSYAKSAEHMVIDGAKGNYGKLADCFKYTGISCETKEVNGETRLDLDTVQDFGKTMATRKDASDVQYATAVKSFGTGIAGTFSQRGMAAFRNFAPTAVLEQTYPVTQSILQSKHDPIEARHKFGVLQSGAKDLWDGYKVGLNEKTGIMQAIDKSAMGNRMTTDEFVDNFIYVYTSKDGLGVDINEDFVRQIADTMSEDGFVVGLSEFGNKHGSIMDKMTYGGKFADLRQAAESGRNVFEGKWNHEFAPSVIRQNEKAMEFGVGIKSIQKSDTKAVVKKEPVIEPKTEDSAVIEARLAEIAATSEVMESPHTGDYGE